MRILGTTLILLCTVFPNLWGQVVVFSNDLEKFPEEFTGQMAKFPNAANSSPTFINFFQNDLDLEGKKEVISLLNFLSQKGLNPMEVVGFTNLLVRYKIENQLSPPLWNSLLVAFKKSFEKQNGSAIKETIAQLLSFLQNSEIYTSSFNKVHASTKQVAFKFLDKKQNYFSEDLSQDTPPTEDIGWGDSFNEEDPWKASSEKYEIDDRLAFPKAEGLYFTFSGVNLSFQSPSDTINLTQTNGAYSFSDNIFYGEGGNITWNVSGRKVEATLSKYSFKSTTGRLLIEKAQILHDQILEKPVQGVLEIVLEKRAKNEPSTYPRFKSYHNNATYHLPLKDYNLLAGYTLVGQKITTSSLFDKYTKLQVHKNSKTSQFEVIGHTLTLTDSLITSDKVSFVARFGQDSVSHPAVQMVYNFKNEHIQLNKVSKGGFRNSMFSDTFHQVDIRCDAMSWNLTSGKMDFYIVAGKDVVAADFESFDYYNASRLSFLSNAAGFNPLMAAANIVARKKKNVITIEEMMQLTKKERFMVSNGMLIGNQMGFFDYHPFGNFYSLSRKGFHYFMVATGRKDYDDLIFSSLNKSGSASKNATIDFNSKSLDITGAQNFKMSDSLGIKLLPDQQSMKVIGNKVFSFQGKIEVKNYTFYGDFVLEYEKFLVNLNRIDSITFVPLEIYKKGGKLTLGSNFLFGKTGKLYLNSPDNKSGRKKMEDFPKLEIPDGVTVYFDEKGRKQKFTENVVFKASSISLDSLNSRNPEFLGIFSLGKILRPIKDQLKMVGDSSMGMNHLPLGTYDLYGSQTSLNTRNKPILLNKNGISTSGEIQHLAATLQTEKIKLFEDYVEASGTEGVITEKEISNAYFPNVSIAKYNMHWNPQKDSMAVYSDKGFDFYNGSTTLKGSIVLRTNGLFGRGDLSRKDSEISSRGFKFDKSGFLANQATLSVKAEKEERLAFLGKNVDINFNVLNDLVNISSQKKDFNQSENAFLEFPLSSYKTTIDQALWSIKEKEITMEGQLENSVFTSTASNQYGLKFNGSSAKYNIDTKSLSISGVKEIFAADAAIQPPAGAVFVKSDGLLEPFKNATIIADTINRYHTLTNASVKINSRLSYTGNADYRYVNISSDTFNIKLGGFEFAEVSQDGQILSSKGSGKLSTIAHAKVTETDSVFLAKKMLYKGELTMMAPFKNLYLKGQVLPDLKRYPMIGGSWIDYQGSKSENVSINIDETLRDGGKPLYVGLHMKYGANTDGLYPSFLSMKGSSDDADVFLARGVFGRDESNHKFYVKTLTETGNTANFNEEKGILELKGQFNLLGAPTKVFETVGVASINLDSSKYRFDTFMSFDFPLAIPIVQKLGNNVVKANLDAGNTTAAIDDDFLELLTLKSGNAAIEKYKTNLQKGHVPLFKENASFLKTLVLSKVNLVWNATANAYYSQGPLGISNIGDVDINALTKGFVEVVSSHSTGNELHIYLDLSPKSWYYFVYRNGQLNMVSSDEEVNKLINTPQGKSKSTTGFLDINEAVKFKKRFLTTYAGITEEEYNKLNPTKTEKKKTKKESDGF